MKFTFLENILYAIKSEWPRYTILVKIIGFGFFLNFLFYMFTFHSKVCMDFDKFHLVYNRIYDLSQFSPILLSTKNSSSNAFIFK